MKIEPYNKLIENFLYWKSAFLQRAKAKNLSPNTIRNYERALDEFEDYLRGYNGEISFSQINKPFLELYLIHLRENRKYSESTISVHFTILKSFFLYITEENDEQADFTKIFRKLAVKKGKMVRPTLAREEVERVIAYVESVARQKGDYASIRDSLIIKLLALTGMRASSLLGLKLYDFTLIEHEGKMLYEILIKQKGNKENRVYVLADEIAWELANIKRFIHGDSLLFLGRDKKPMHRVSLYNKVVSLLKKSGINKKGVHIFRHTFVKLKREEGVDLSTIKALLGHSSITTTINIYGAADERDKINAALSGKKSKRGN